MRRQLPIAMIATFATAVAAQVDPDSAVPTTSASVAELVSQLGTEDWQTREKAQEILLFAGDARLSQIESFLKMPGITEEQRLRLTHIGRHRFMIEPRAAMGVTFDPPVDGGIMIRSSVQGYDSASVLEPGDIVMAMDDRRIRTQDELRSAIVSYDPGDGVIVTLKRRGVTQQVALTLGSYAMLPQASNLYEGLLLQAWAVRMERLGLADPQGEMVLTGLSWDSWDQIARQGDNAAPDLSVPAAHPQDTSLVPGGEAISHVQAMLARVGLRTRGGSRVVVIQPRNDADADATPAGRAAALSLRADQLRAQQQAALINLTNLRRRAQTPGLTDAQQRDIDLSILDATAQLRSITDELTSTNLELARIRGNR